MQQRVEVDEGKFTAFPPGYEVAQVKLQHDDAAVEKVALRFASVLLGTSSNAWPACISGQTKDECTACAHDEPGMIDDMQGKRLFMVQMPGGDDDGRVLRELFGAAADQPA